MLRAVQVVEVNESLFMRSPLVQAYAAHPAAEAALLHQAEGISACDADIGRPAGGVRSIASGRADALIIRRAAVTGSDNQRESHAIPQLFQREYKIAVHFIAVTAALTATAGELARPKIVNF